MQVAILGALLDLRAAGIGQAQQLGGLVERFADGVIERRAEPLVVADAAHGHDLRVAAGREKQAIGKRRVVDQPCRQRMRFKMIDGDQRLVGDQRDRLGGGQPDDDTADQAGSCGGRDSVDGGDCLAGVAQGLAR